MDAIRAHNFKASVDLGARTYSKMKRAFPQLQDLPSLHQLQSQIASLSGVKPVPYHCCKNSCCLYVGPYADLDSCPYCPEPRYDSQRRPRAIFEYFPLIPRLQAMYADPEMSETLRKGPRHASKDGKISDIWDSLHIRRLRKRHVSVEDTVYEHLFLDAPSDLVFGLSADGVCPFKNRKSTCW
ncbi:hypothetical protein GGX14DRAFT_383402, partial [Mycena pura]